MITKAQIQFIRSLEQKRARNESGCFLVEGEKLVREALKLPSIGNFQVKAIYGIESWLDSNVSEWADYKSVVTPVTSGDLDKMSSQKTPNQVLSVIYHSQTPSPEFDTNSSLLIGLNQIQDPGNVGTIVRLADWFGLAGVIASPDSADFFSPKVVQSSMGSIFRVKLITAELRTYIQSLPLGYPVYGTILGGQNIYTAELSKNGLILFGNESKGLSQELINLTTKNLQIPDFAPRDCKPESLNVSVAAAVVCSEFRRRENF